MIDIPIAILCGGKGTRLGELTANTPKSLVKVAGKHFLAHQLDLLRAQGAKKVVLCIGHLGQQIIEAFGNDYHGVGLLYSRDSEPLGQLGAVDNAMPLLGDEWMVLYGDSYLDIDYGAIIAERRRLGVPIIQAVYNGTDYGVTVFTKEGFETLPEFATMSNLTIYGLAHPYVMESRFYQIGDPEGLKEVQWLLSHEFTGKFMAEVEQVASLINQDEINAMVGQLVALRERGGRLFILGVGGSAANASHAVNDFRKLCDIEAYAPTDNVSEYSARANDDGLRNTFAQWLRGSRTVAKDALLVLSVGGGQDTAPGTSVNIAYAVQEANRVGTPVLAILGRDGGYTAQHAQSCVMVPTVNPAHVTPHAEAFQAVVWHLLVSHPLLKRHPTKW